MVKTFILGVVDPDGDPLTITVTSIKQDEPPKVSESDLCPDAQGLGRSTPLLRAQRLGVGDGRVYHVAFTASDGKGGTCNGTVTVCVPNEHFVGPCIDEGPLFDSTRCP